MAIEEQFILLSIGLATIGVRVGGRWHYAGPANWELDDYLMPLIGVSKAHWIPPERTLPKLFPLAYLSLCRP